MSEAKLALLSDRGAVSVTGEDARKLLQGLVTNTLDDLPDDGQPGVPQAIHTGLLSPQGKIQFEFFVVTWDNGLLLDVAAAQVAELVKRLNLYKLRAKAVIKDETDHLAVVAVWDGVAPASFPPRHFIDPRHPALGARWLAPASLAGTSQGMPANIAAAEYHAHRIALGIPEGGKDYDFGDAFPHEANFDLLNGVAFEKGCYVGQEIVSRMQHRATVRKRIVRVSGAADLPSVRPDIKAGDVVIGKLGSVAGVHGLAMLRLDRAIDAIDRGEPITTQGIALAVETEALARHRATMAERASHP